MGSINRLPSPTALSTVKGTASRSAAFFARYSPSPLDFCPMRPLSPVYPRSKIRGRSSGGMPMPVSAIVRTPFSVRMATVPVGVYLTALEMSCSRIQQNHFLSVTMRSPVGEKSSRSFFSRKSGANFLVTTHYPEVKDFAAGQEGIINARMTFDRETLMPTYRMVIGEAGESCAFYIADRLGMPAHMLETAVEAAYGREKVKDYMFRNNPELSKRPSGKISKTKKTAANTKLGTLYNIGDSVMVYPDKKIGIVCEPVNDKGVLRVQIADRKIWINHKRVKLHVKAEELYPEDYDFSIVFDTVKNRKVRHDMDRKYTEETIVYDKA